jgi:lysophospholipase L1-like esterase
VGLAGAALEAVRAGERAWLEGSFSRMRLYLLRQPGGGTVRVSADGRRLDERPLAAPCPEVAVVERVLGPAPACHRIQIDTVADGRSRILGLALEGPAGGVYSGLGLDGARASWLLRLPEAVLAAQVGREAPDLIVLAFGTNEATGGGFDPAGYERGLAEVLDRLRRSAPRAALLLVAPPDAAFRDGRPDSLGRIATIQQKEAGLVRAGFVNLRAAMGGAGSIRRWRSAGLARPDLVHFTPLGYSRHARAILTGVFRGLERGQGLEAVRGDARPEASRGPGT